MSDVPPQGSSKPPTPLSALRVEQISAQHIFYSNCTFNGFICLLFFKIRKHHRKWRLLQPRRRGNPRSFNSLLQIRMGCWVFSIPMLRFSRCCLLPNPLPTKRNLGVVIARLLRRTHKKSLSNSTTHPSLRQPLSRSLATQVPLSMKWILLIKYICLAKKTMIFET